MQVKRMLGSHAIAWIEEKMEKQYTFVELIIDVFNEVKKPMSPEEIWEKARELSLDKK